MSPPPAITAEQVSLSASIDYNSKYVFRGVELAEAVVQPGIEVGVGDFYGGVWASKPIEDASSYSEETDYYIGYGFDLAEGIGADVGVTRYAYDDGGASDTTELFAGVSFAAPLAPSAYLYYDLDLEATTLEGSLSHSYAVNQTATVDISAALGTVDADGGDYQYGTVGATYTVALNDTIGAYAGLNYGLSSQDTFDSGQEQHGTWFSVGLSFSK